MEGNQPVRGKGTSMSAEQSMEEVAVPRDGYDFVVVSNRLPVDRDVAEDGSSTWRRSPGGLVSALAPVMACLLYTSPSPRDLSTSRMPSSA